MDLPNDEIVTLGAYIEDLLSQEEFNTLVRYVQLTAYQNFQSTAPSDKEGRELAYAEFNGLRNFLDQMMTIVHRRDELIKELETPSSSDDAYPDE